MKTRWYHRLPLAIATFVLICVLGPAVGFGAIFVPLTAGYPPPFLVSDLLDGPSLFAAATIVLMLGTLFAAAVQGLMVGLGLRFRLRLLIAAVLPVVAVLVALVAGLLRYHDLPDLPTVSLMVWFVASVGVAAVGTASALRLAAGL